MRALACLAVVTLLLAGCTSHAPKAAANQDATNFQDLGAQATSSTGVLLGVVVDEAIRPLKGASIEAVGPDGGNHNATSDALGRFAFSELTPGAYIVKASMLNFQDAQTSTNVQAGVDQPPVVRLQLTRLFSQAPYSEQIVFDGFLSCAYSFSISSTCVNDYTRIVGQQCLPTGQCYCAGGCLRDYNVSKVGGNIREYVSTVTANWQEIVFEETWTPSSNTGSALGMTVSYFSRPDSGHWFGTASGASPTRLEFDVGVQASSAQYSSGQPTMIPTNGTNELFTFFGAGDSSLVLNQKFKSFETHFYFGKAPDGWSFAKDQPLPF